jgi:hypothetical protein
MCLRSSVDFIIYLSAISLYICYVKHRRYPNIFFILFKYCKNSLCAGNDTFNALPPPRHEKVLREGICFHCFLYPFDHLCTGFTIYHITIYVEQIDLIYFMHLCPYLPLLQQNHLSLHI